MLKSFALSLCLLVAGSSFGAIESECTGFTRSLNCFAQTSDEFNKDYTETENTLLRIRHLEGIVWANAAKVCARLAKEADETCDLRKEGQYAPSFTREKVRVTIQFGCRKSGSRDACSRKALNPGNGYHKDSE